MRILTQYEDGGVDEDTPIDNKPETWIWEGISYNEYASDSKYEIVWTSDDNDPERRTQTTLEEAYTVGGYTDYGPEGYQPPNPPTGGAPSLPTPGRPRRSRGGIGYNPGVYSGNRISAETRGRRYFPGHVTETNPYLVPVLGAIQTIGGVFEVAGGGYTAVQSAGLGALPAYLAIARGVDDIQAGSRTLWSGEFQDTLVFTGVKQVAGEDIANVVDIGSGLLSVGGTAVGAVKTARNGAIDTATRSIDDIVEKADDVVCNTPKAPKGLVGEVGESANNWLGEGFIVKRSDAKGFVAISKDGTRKLRMDFDGHGFPPHGHLEIWDAVNQRWVDAIPGKHHLPFQ